MLRCLVNLNRSACVLSCGYANTKLPSMQFRAAMITYKTVSFDMFIGLPPSNTQTKKIFVQKYYACDNVH